jgi:hypothetical protein
MTALEQYAIAALAIALGLFFANQIYDEVVGK